MSFIDNVNDRLSSRLMCVCVCVSGCKKRSLELVSLREIPLGERCANALSWLANGKQPFIIYLKASTC